MIDLEERVRLYHSRVVESGEFDPANRMLWIELRNSALEWARYRPDPKFADLEAALDQVSLFPETCPDEPARWSAVCQALDELFDADA